MKKYNLIFTCFRVCKGRSNDDVEGARGTVFQEIHGRELVSKPAISSKKRWGGYRSKTLAVAGSPPFSPPPD